MGEDVLDGIKRLRGLSDKELADVILECLRPAVLRNATRIKASAIESGFVTSFRLGVKLDLSDPKQMGVKTTGCIEPAVFESVRIGKSWETQD